MAEKNFVQGLFIKRHPKAPSFVICNLGIKVDEFVKWLRENQQGEYTNLDVKLSKAGDKYYAELNTYNPADKHLKVQEQEDNQSKLNNLEVEKTIEYPEDEIDVESIPF
jgi:hypothetical protein